MTDQEINEQVARKLGWVQDGNIGWIQPEPHPDGFLIGHAVLPDFCRSIEAAWEVVESYLCVSEEYYFCLEFNAMYWEAGWRTTDNNHAVGWSSADTAPMAIVKCFLKLMENKNG